MRFIAALVLTALLAITPVLSGCSDETEVEAPTEQSVEEAEKLTEEAKIALEDPIGLTCEEALAYAETAGYEYTFEAPSGYDVVDQLHDESGCYTESMSRAKVIDYDFTEGGWLEASNIRFYLSMPIAVSPDDDQALKEFLDGSATDEGTLREFANSYTGKVIEFDCWVSGSNILSSYYRDYHFAPGAKDQGKNSQFIISNIGYSELKLVDSDEHLRAVMVDSPLGYNLHLIALVNGFNEEAGLIDISPVESWIIY